MDGFLLYQMKNALLILLMLLLPWQTITAAQRNFAHVMDSQQSTASFIKHFSEHVKLVMHHHDSEDDHGSSAAHEDDSEQSARHLVDFDHGFSVNVLFSFGPAVAALPADRIAPVIRPDSFDNHTIRPLRRPPRTLV